MRTPLSRSCQPPSPAPLSPKHSTHLQLGQQSVQVGVVRGLVVGGAGLWVVGEEQRERRWWRRRERAVRALATTARARSRARACRHARDERAPTNALVSQGLQAPGPRPGYAGKADFDLSRAAQGPAVRRTGARPPLGWGQANTLRESLRRICGPPHARAP